MSVHLPALTTAMVPELSALTLGVATFAGVVLAMMETELTVKVGKSYQTMQHTKFVYSAIHVPVPAHLQCQVFLTTEHNMKSYVPKLRVGMLLSHLDDVFIHVIKQG